MKHASSYAEQQRDPRKHLIGISTVIVFHVVLVYALANGLGRKVIEVIKSPLDVAIIEEIKAPPPPPPPPKVVAAPPKSSAPPPPAYAPPPDTPAPSAPAPVITTSSTPTPPAPPPAPAVPVAPPAVNVAVACPNFRSVTPQMPAQAERMGLSGDVVVEFTVAADGNIKDVAIARSSNSVFNPAAAKAVSQYRCVGQGRDVRVKQMISFRVDN
ncbi:energy transducer TonB [Quatrionicoccus australiensis]|uniref:energy transducer TonB n=1 Tax=Quatrionicoccus australiensis TaxID=138118 RepID=UPI001CFB5E92|nr:energy transducer TonB [Quatrionicoccus australiensis]MCB4358816.1 energy transducer TonB [Quatrionicoccus australiensis]